MIKTVFMIFAAILLGCLVAGQVNAQVAQPKITFSGGPGDTPETAVVITGASNSMDGIAAEYHYLGKKFGRRHVDWNLRRQSVMQQQGKVYDRMELDLKDGSQKTVFFDISEFFGKL